MIFPIRRTGIHQLMLSRDYDVKIDRYLNKTRIYLEQNNFFFANNLQFLQFLQIISLLNVIKKIRRVIVFFTQSMNI